MSGTIPLSYVFAIGLGILIVLAFLAGLVRLYINKKTLKANQKKADEEAASKNTDREKIIGQRELAEGDYFGVRALEHGYFGGVAQSRPSSPTPSTTSSYKLAPEAKLVDWGQVNNLRSDSSSIASSSLDNLQDRNASSTSLPAGTRTVKKPSPLGSHSVSSVGGIGGSYMPPPTPTSARSIRSPSPLFNEEKKPGWVSPLDVHFSKPTSPAARPTSFLPKLQFPSEFGKSELSTPLPGLEGPKSETASVVNTEVSIPSTTAQSARMKSPREIYTEFSQQDTSAKSPTFSTFSKEEPPKSNSPTFSVFPQSARSPQDDFANTFQLPPVPVEDLKPKLSSVDPDQFPQEGKAWNPASPIRDSILNRQRQPTAVSASDSQEWTLPSSTLPDSTIDAQWQPSSNAIIRESVVSKQRVSVMRGPHAQSQDLNVQSSKLGNRTHSMAASSMYSTRSSILETQEENATRHARSRSQSSEARRSVRGWSKSSQRRSSRSISQTRDSLRRRRKTSSDSNCRSGDWDQLDFDTTSHRRHRSGSVPGGSTDSDQPRESPFSNSNQKTDHSHSASSSISSFETDYPPKPVLSRDQSRLSSLQAPVPALIYSTQDPGRLSIAPQFHKRSASEASQNSIGEFYDSYYRQSTMGLNGRISGLPAVLQIGLGSSNNRSVSRNSVQDRAQAFEDRARRRSGSVGPRRPAPLKLGSAPPGGEVGSGYGGFGPIVEVATPMQSPLIVGSDLQKERIPHMI